MLDTRLQNSTAYKIEAEENLQRSRLLNRNQDFAGAIEAAQHCIGLSLKSMLELCDVHSAKKHDVSSAIPILIRKLDGCSEKLTMGLSRSQWIMRMWEPVHNLAFYGTDDTKPQDLFHEEDANIAIHYAEDAYWTCFQIHLDLSEGRLRIKGQHSTGGKL
jgi:HEPN domain-containing protein